MAVKKIGFTALDTSVSQSLGTRNRIINGVMQVNQRNSANVSANGYTVDRWKFATTNTALGGAVNYGNTTNIGLSGGVLAFSTTTAGSSLNANDNINICQSIEGLNVADLMWGTQWASPVTLSFWVRASTSGSGSGNYSGAIQNNDKTLSYVFTFNIPTASYWTYVKITIPGPTYGTWTKDNTAGMHVVFNLGAGSTFTSTVNNAWDWGNFTTTSAVTVQTIANASYGSYSITQVQLEKGSVATPFEWRSYNTELALCQRYCYAVSHTSTTGHLAPFFAVSSTTGHAVIPLPVQPRVPPTGIVSNSNWYMNNAGPGNAGSGALAFLGADSSGVSVQLSAGTGMTAGYAGWLYASAGNTATLYTSGSEL